LGCFPPGVATTTASQLRDWRGSGMKTCTAWRARPILTTSICPCTASALTSGGTCRLIPPSCRHGARAHARASTSPALVNPTASAGWPPPGGVSTARAVLACAWTAPATNNQASADATTSRQAPPLPKRLENSVRLTRRYCQSALANASPDERATPDLGLDSPNSHAVRGMDPHRTPSASRCRPLRLATNCRWTGPAGLSVARRRAPIAPPRVACEGGTRESACRPEDRTAQGS